MKSLGIARKIDGIGRVTLPMEVRKVNVWNEGDHMEFFTDAHTVIIRKLERGCTFCKGTSGLKEFGGHEVCGHCREDMRKLYREGKV